MDGHGVIIYQNIYRPLGIYLKFALICRHLLDVKILGVIV